jgi:hypothetical protein
VRVAARLNSSPATLVHATSSTVSARTVKITPNLQLMSSPRVRISNWVRTSAPRPWLSAGYSRSKLRATTASSARASSRLAPSCRRALTLSSRSSRSSKKRFCGSVEKTGAIASGT